MGLPGEIQAQRGLFQLFQLVPPQIAILVHLLKNHISAFHTHIRPTQRVEQRGVFKHTYQRCRLMYREGIRWDIKVYF